MPGASPIENNVAGAPTFPTGSVVDSGGGPTTTTAPPQNPSSPGDAALYSRIPTPQNPNQSPADPRLYKTAVGANEGEIEGMANENIMGQLGQEEQAINAQYDKILNDSRQSTEASNLGRSNAAASLLGLSGGTGAVAVQEGAGAKNAAAETKIQIDRTNALNHAQDAANKAWTTTQAELQKQNDAGAPGTPNAAITEAQTTAKDALQQIASTLGNVTYAQFKATDPNTYNKFLQTLGGGKGADAVLELLYSDAQKSNIAGKSSIADYKVLNGHIYQYDPTTGNLNPRQDLEEAFPSSALTAQNGSAPTVIGGEVYALPLNAKGKAYIPPGSNMDNYKVGNVTPKPSAAKPATTTTSTTSPGSTVVGTTGSPTMDSTAPGYTNKSVAGGLSQAAIDQAALQFALTGVMPSMGLGSTGDAGTRRVAIQNRAAELDSGGNIQANKAQLTAQSRSLTTQVAYLNTVQRSLANAEGGMNQLVTAFQGKVNNTSMPIANIIANAAKYNFGSADVNSFKAALQEVANEYTQVFSRGGQVSDNVRSRAQDIVNGNISINDLSAVGNELQQQGKIVIQGTQTQIKTIQNGINGIIQTGNQGQSQSVQLRDPKTGEVRSFSNLSSADLQNAQSQGYILINQ